MRMGCRMCRSIFSVQRSGLALGVCGLAFEFVPKRLAEGSQAIYCLESVLEKIRPVGNGMVGLPARSLLKIAERSFRPNHTVP